MAMAGAVLWVLRARFFLFEVLRFGTAMGRNENGKGWSLDESAPLVAQLP